jgi:hypothetical protein
MEELDIYPVGLLQELIYFRRGYRHAESWSKLLYSLKYPFRRVGEGNWRAVRNYFNGYLAEPAEWPPGVTSCGRGWTRRAAVRDWHRKISAP